MLLFTLEKTMSSDFPIGAADKYGIVLGRVGDTRTSCKTGYTADHGIQGTVLYFYFVLETTTGKTVNVSRY